MADNPPNQQDANSQALPIQPAIPPDQSEPDESGFFQEDNGSKSSMRLMCFISLMAAILFGCITLWLSAHSQNDGGNGVIITFGFLLGAFAPKAVQKFAEQKVPSKGL